MSLTVSSDEHTLAVKVHPVVTQQQLGSAFQFLLDAARKMNPDFATTFVINMVQVKGVRTGRAFVWIASPKVYHMILGNNPDGTSRIVRVKDPNWQPPSIQDILGEPISSDPSQPVKRNWADWAEEEDETEPAIIEEQLPSLLPIPIIRLSPEQQASHEEKVASITIKIEPALAHDVEHGLSHNVLKSSSLLPFMTEDFLKKEFQRFSHSKNNFPQRTGKSNRQGRAEIIQVPYPIVKIVPHHGNKGPEKIAYITFDSATRDASFAFHMMRRREYKNSNTGETFVVNYSYAKAKNYE